MKEKKALPTSQWSPGASTATQTDARNSGKLKSSNYICIAVEKVNRSPGL